MTNLERLKLELSNKEYYTDDEYTVFLEENNLTPTDAYDKTTMQIQLLYTVVSVLETLSNDVDLMRKIQTNDIATVDQAFEWLDKRLTALKNKIDELEEEKLKKEEEGFSDFKPLFFNRRG